MQFFVTSSISNLTNGPFDTLQSAIEDAEQRAGEMLRETAPEARAVRDAGFTLTLKGTPSIAPELAMPLGVELRGRYNRADWHGIQRPTVHAEVIYTFKAKLALLASDNEDAYVDQFGDEPGTVEQRAFCAIEADVRAMLAPPYSDMGLDPTELLALETGACDGQDFDIDDDETYPARLADADDLRASIIKGTARALYCGAWASAVELACDIGDTDAPDLSGCKIEDEAPETSDAAEAKAVELIADLETRVAEAGIGAYFHKRIVRQTYARNAHIDVAELAELFGHYIVMESLGHGVAWDDDADREPHDLAIGRVEYSEAFTFRVTDDDMHKCGEHEVGRGSRPDETYIVRMDGDSLVVEVEGYA